MSAHEFAARCGRGQPAEALQAWWARLGTRGAAGMATGTMVVHLLKEVFRERNICIQASCLAVLVSPFRGKERWANSVSPLCERPRPSAQRTRNALDGRGTSSPRSAKSAKPPSHPSSRKLQIWQRLSQRPSWLAHPRILAPNPAHASLNSFR